MQTHRKGAHPVDHEEALSVIRDSRFQQRGGSAIRRPLYEPMRPLPTTPTPRGDAYRSSHAPSFSEYSTPTPQAAVAAGAVLGGGQQSPEQQGGLPRPILKKPSMSSLDAGPVPSKLGPSRPSDRRRIEFSSHDSEPPAYGDYGSSHSAVTSDASGVPVWSPSQETCTAAVNSRSLLIDVLYECSSLWNTCAAVDWKSLTLPASLPVTTDFEPDSLVLRHRYKLYPYELSDPGALLCGLPDFEGNDADKELENTLSAFLCSSTLGYRVSSHLCFF